MTAWPGFWLGLAMLCMSVCHTDIVNMPSPPPSPCLLVLWVIFFYNSFFLDVFRVGKRRDQQKCHHLIRSGLACFFPCMFLACWPCCMPSWLPLFWVSGCQQLGRVPGPRKADLLGQDTFTNMPYIDLIVLWQSWQPSDLPGCPLPCFVAFPPSFSIPRLSLSLLEELKTELEMEILWLY